MTRRTLWGGVAHRFGAAIALLSFLNSGCGGPATPPPYEPSARYTLRSDPVVLQLPPTHPTSRPPAGKMDEFVKDLEKLGGKLADPGKLSEPRREQLQAALEKVFGTPAEPTVIGADANAVQLLALEPTSLKTAAGGYKVRCVQCHGQAGDGRGPNAAFLDPYPRDFRTGSFKRATGAAHNGKPRLDDIVMTLRSGVKGTAMPMFDLIAADEVRATAGYLVHLAIRGEVEAETVKRLLSDGDDALDDPEIGVQESTAKVLKAWVAAQASDKAVSVNEADFSTDSIRRGQQLFVGKAGCVACHEKYGKKEIYRYDVRGLPNRVRDLTDPDYRWGGKPDEIAYRIRFGIHTSNMPANPLLSDAEIRDLVSFVLTMPYPAKLPEDVRAEVEK